MSKKQSVKEQLERFPSRSEVRAFIKIAQEAVCEDDEEALGHESGIAVRRVARFLRQAWEAESLRRGMGAKSVAIPPVRPQATDGLGNEVSTGSAATDPTPKSLSFEGGSDTVTTEKAS